MKTARVYVAGNYSRNPRGEQANVIEVISNMREGIFASAQLLDGDWDYPTAVYCPWLDFWLGLLSMDDILVETYRRNSMAWLKVSDVLYVISGQNLGGGVDAEIAFAKEHNIPVVYDETELNDFLGDFNRDEEDIMIDEMEALFEEDEKLEQELSEELSDDEDEEEDL
jgi:hypothetical protein